jgi:photosystem II stability/assembly factor-like uncharacterized protein
VVTTNGWSTWKVYQVPDQLTLFDVSCDPGGFCGASAMDSNPQPWFLSSTDGGAHWTVHDVPLDADGSFSDYAVTAPLACAHSHDCVLVGQTSVTRAGGRLVWYTALFRTLDGGRTWTDHKLPPSVTNLNDVACPSSARCYATGSTASDGLIFDSATGGATWKLVLRWSTIRSIDSITCPSPVVCEAVGSGAAPGTVDAVRTTTGGASWSRHAVASGGTFAFTEALGIACRTLDACLIAGAFPGGVLETTGNGGVSWSPADVPAAVTTLGELSCPASGVCEATAYAGPPRLGTYSMERTTNDGASWQVQSLPTGIGELLSLTCPTVTTCLAVDFDGVGSLTKILTTTDSGASWTETSPPSGVFFPEVTCATATACIMSGFSSGDDAPYYTTDGGTTWHRGSLPTVPGTDFYDFGRVSCVSATTCFASGDLELNGSGAVATFFKTTDGGAVWSAVSVQGSGQSDSSDLPGSISCTSATTCVSVGLNYPPDSFTYSGPGQVSVFVSTNGGTTWTEEFSIGAVIGSASNVSCSVGGFCEMVGTDVAGGVAYSFASLDGGVTWTAAAMPVGWLQSDSLSCPAANACMSTGSLTNGGTGVATLG